MARLTPGTETVTAGASGQLHGSQDATSQATDAGGGLLGAALTPFTGGLSSLSSLWGGSFGGIGSALDFFKGALWLINPVNWLRLWETIIGFALILIGIIRMFDLLGGRFEQAEQAMASQRGLGEVFGETGAQKASRASRERKVSVAAKATRKPQARAQTAKRGQAKQAAAKKVARKAVTKGLA